jgi:hypothetical protein
MEDRLNKLERLDIAARANIAGDMLHRRQGWLLLMAVICALLGANSTASPTETLAVRAAAGTYAVLFVLFLLKWRYSFHAVVLASFGTAIIDYWLYPQLHLHSDWIGRLLSACVFISMGLTAWPWAMPFATVHKKGWKEDRRAAEKLYEMLLYGTGLAESSFVSSGNFWIGYFDYRLLYFEDYWAVAKFKRGKLHMLEFRVLEKDGVRVTAAEDAKLKLYIAGKKIRSAELSPERHEKLLHLAMVAGL